MKEIQLSLKGTSPYSQSRPHTTPKLNKETPDAHEARTWMNRLHVKDGQVFIPGNAIRNCLAEAAKFLSIQIPGKGKATYTKHNSTQLFSTQLVQIKKRSFSLENDRFFTNNWGTNSYI